MTRVRTGSLPAAILMATGTCMILHVLQWPTSFSGARTVVGRQPHNRRASSGILLRAEGFAPKETETSTGFAPPVMPDRSNIFDPNAAPEKIEVPTVKLPGPLKPPAAPATYKALTKIRLRVDPSKYSEIVTSTEIPKGATFRAVDSREDEDGTLFIRTSGEYEGGWLLEKGIVGKWAGKRVIKRVVHQCNADEGTAVHAVSEIDRAEVAPPDEASRSGNQAVGGRRAQELYENDESQKDTILEALEDPKIAEVLKQSGISADMLKTNPEMLKAVQRALFGDEVVG